MTAVVVEPGVVVDLPAAPKQRPRWLRILRATRPLWPTPDKLLFLAVLALSLALGWFMRVHYSVDFGDSLARLAEARAVTASRNPHLAAIGFHFMPLPTLLLVPFTWLGAHWPVLLTRGYLSSIESALFMAGGAVVLRRTLAEWRVPLMIQYPLVAGYVLHPLMLFYAGSGMSEPIGTFFVILAVRYLSQWLSDPSRASALGKTGVALAGCYLTRIEAVGAILVVPLLVYAVSALRADGRWRSRMRVAAIDLVLVALPPGAVVVVLALVEKALVGRWFYYGDGTGLGHATAKQMVTMLGGTTPLARLRHAILEIASLEPLLGVLAVIAVVLLLVRREVRGLAVLAVAGPIVGGTLAAQVLGHATNALRYYCPTVPMAVLLAGLLATRPLSATRSLKIRAAQWSLATVAGVAAIGTVTPSLPTAWAALGHSSIARQEAPAFHALVDGGRLNRTQRLDINAFSTERAVARYLDGMHLRDGAVLADTQTAFAIEVASTHPTQFVITSDRDFERSLADPVTFHVQYLLVPRMEAMTFDRLNAAYPRLYDNGAGIATLVKSWPQMGDGFAWRLYQLRPDAVTGVG